MSGIVHFKFKSSNSYDSVGFDGAFISVGELKVLIAEKKGLSKDATSELLLSDPRTQREYTDDAAVVPKSSSVLVRRVPNLPAAHLQQQQPALATEQPSSSQAIVKINETAAPETEAATAAGEDDFGGDLYSEQRDEDEALEQLLSQAGQNWEKEVRSSTARGRGRGRGRDMSSRGFGRGRGHEAEPIILPKGYICYRCGQQGHHISDCPTNTDPDFKRIRPAVGVPSVLLTKDKEGGLLLPDGTTGSLQPNEDAFLKETMGMPGAKAAAKANGSAGPTDGSKESDSKALVVRSEAEPALAGGGDMALPIEGQGLLMPPGAGPRLPWDGPGLPPFPPGMPMPGMSGDQPLSKEEFLRMKEEMRRRHQSASRSRSRSRSRHSDRRRRGRDSRSPRRRDSRSPRRGYKHRRRHSKERSQSRERRPYQRRRSPSPGFIQLRKRSRNPPPRRQRQGTPDFIQLRHRDSGSPPRRRTRHAEDLGRWNPDADEGEPAPIGRDITSTAGGVVNPMTTEPYFGDSFDTRSEEPSMAAKASPNQRPPFKPADFRAPQLLDDAGPSYYDPPVEQRKETAMRAGVAKQGLKSGLGIRGGQRLQKDAAAPGEGQGKVDKAASLKRGESPMAAGPSKPEDATVAEEGRHGPLPKTFSIPVAENIKEKKQKKAKKAKDKDKSKKSSKHRDTSPALQEPEKPVESPSKPQQAAHESEAPREASRLAAVPEEALVAQPQGFEGGHRNTERTMRSPLFLRAMTDASGREKKTDLATATLQSEPKGTEAAKMQTEKEIRVEGPQEDTSEGREGHKKKKEHKHKSKKKHKEKRSKEDR